MGSFNIQKVKDNKNEVILIFFRDAQNYACAKTHLINIFVRHNEVKITFFIGWKFDVTLWMSRGPESPSLGSCIVELILPVTIICVIDQHNVYWVKSVRYSC